MIAAAHRDVLAGIVGDAHVREAQPGDDVAGVVPSLVVAPADERQVAGVLACASRDSLRVVVRGGGTKLRWGPPPRGCDVVLSTARLDAVVEHEPGDLVCVAQSGVRLDALQASLAPHRQQLMLDPPHGVAATLGGIVTAGAWGPLRTRYGTARDLLIGARFVLADGTVGHSGGKVVKNVAGYDVARLLVGSLGTLAVLTQVALRLHPLPHASRTVAFDGVTDSAWQAVERAPVVASKAVVLWPDAVMLVRIDGSEGGVDAQVRALPPGRVLDDTEAAQAWSRVGSTVWGDDDTAVAAIAVPRFELAALLDRLQRAVALSSLGVVEAVVDADEVTTLRAWVEQRGGHLVLRRPTPDTAADAWPTNSDPAVDLMRAVKQRLDPGGTLAPGRHVGGI